MQWCFSSKISETVHNTKPSEFELEEKGKESKTPDQNEKKERKPASKVYNVIIKSLISFAFSQDAPLRWVGVGVLVFITVLVQQWLWWWLLADTQLHVILQPHKIAITHILTLYFE